MKNRAPIRLSAAWSGKGLRTAAVAWFLLAVAGGTGAGAGEPIRLDDEPGRPGRLWSSRTRQVNVATPEGRQWKTIVYYRNSIGMEFVRIPGGEFLMGSRDSDVEVARKGHGEPKYYLGERPRHRVRITGRFLLGAHEVTQAQYEQIMGKNPSEFKGARHPVENVSWDDAVEFCRRLSKREGVTYRLPTEAEWEYACRAGSTGPFYFGETISTHQANFNGTLVYGRSRKGIWRRRPLAVGSFPANAFGLFDLHGNVWEWCRDWYQENYYFLSPAADPTGPASGKFHVVRGGSWFSRPRLCRSAYRHWHLPALRWPNVGFRLVLRRP